VNLSPGTYELQLRNAAKAQTQGLEASLKELVTEHLKLGANIGLLNARFTSFPSGLDGRLDAAGKHLPEAPDMSISVTVNYTIPAPSLDGSFELDGEDSYRSKSSSEVNIDPTVFGIDSRNIVNARMSYINDHHHLQISLFATNLFNDQYIAIRGRDFLGNGLITRGDPQMIGLQARYDF